MSISARNSSLITPHIPSATVRLGAAQQGAAELGSRIRRAKRRRNAHEQRPAVGTAQGNRVDGIRRGTDEADPLVVGFIRCAPDPMASAWHLAERPELAAVLHPQHPVGVDSLSWRAPSCQRALSWNEKPSRQPS
jgi:hypothetical protein